MAQVHSFDSPNAYNPYPNFFGMNANFNPWLFSNNWLERETQCWHDYWELISWQQKTIQQNTQDTMQVMTHLIQLAPQPSHLYRYLRLNWQKPYIHLSAQILTSMRLSSKLMTQNWCAMQAMMAPEKKH